MSKVNFTSNDVHRSLWRISAPMMVLSVLDYLLVFINLGWLLALSDEQNLPTVFRVATAVVGIFEATFGGLLGAVYIFANQRFGSKDHAAAQHLIKFGFGLSVAVGVLVAVSGSWLARMMLGGFGIEEVTKDQIARYLSAYWYGYVFVVVHLYGGLVAKMTGDIKLMVTFRLVTFVANLLTTPLFVIYALHHGMDPLKAAAVALIVSRVLGLAVLGVQLMRSQAFPFSLGVDVLPRRVFKQWPDLSKLAVAETVNGLSLTVSFFLFFVIVSYYESGTLAALTVAQYMTGFVQTVMLGVAASLIPFVAQNAGQQNIDNISKGVWWMTQRTLVVCLAAGAPFIAFAPWFVQFFVSEPVLAAQTVDYIRITTLPWAFLMASFPFIFAVVGLGDTRGTLVLTVWSMYIGNLLPMVLVLKFVDTSTRWAAAAESFAHGVTFVGCVLYYLWKERQLRQAWGAPARAAPPAQPVETKIEAAT